MDTSGEVADLMVKEGIQLTESAVKLLAAGTKNLAAFLIALSQNHKKLYGKTNMKQLLQAGRELKTFHIKESDLDEFRSYAKKNILFSVVKDMRTETGIVDLITNVDYVPLVNHFMERRGYAAPALEQEEQTPKKSAPRTQPGPSSPERGNGWKPSRTGNTRTGDMTRTIDAGQGEARKPSVRSRLEVLRAASQGMGEKAPQRVPTLSR